MAELEYNSTRDEDVKFGGLNVKIGVDGPTVQIIMEPQDGPVAEIITFVPRNYEDDPGAIVEATKALFEGNHEAISKQIAEGDLTSVEDQVNGQFPDTGLPLASIRYEEVYKHNDGMVTGMHQDGKNIDIADKDVDGKPFNISVEIPEKYSDLNTSETRLLAVNAYDDVRDVMQGIAAAMPDDLSDTADALMAENAFDAARGRVPETPTPIVPTISTPAPATLD